MSDFFTNRRLLFQYLCLGLITIAAYANSLGNGFVWDDWGIIAENPLLQGIGNLPTLLVTEDTFPEMRTGFYRPLAYLSFFVDRAVWGLNPFGFHLTNVLLHAAVTIAFCSLLRGVVPDGRVAFLTALLFALHPVNAGTVNFLSGGRNTLLCALGSLLALQLHRNGQRIAAVIAFAVAVFSKEFALLLPFFLFHAGKAQEEGKKSRMRAVLPYFAVAALYLVIRSIVLEGAGIHFTPDQLGNRLLFVPQLVITYLGMVVAPLHPKVLYVIPYPASFDISVIVYVAGLAGVALAVYAARQCRPVLWGGWWFLIFLLPVSNLISLGSITLAERYVYLSAMGVCLAAVYAAEQFVPRVTIPALFLVAVLFGIATTGRNAIWHDDLAFYSRMAADAPHASHGYLNLGVYYAENGELAKAEAALGKALDLPPYDRRESMALSNLYVEAGETEKAVKVLERAVARDPGSFESYFMLGRIWEVSGNAALARKNMQKAEALFPQVRERARQRAMQVCAEAEWLQKEGKLRKAKSEYREALLYEPQSARILTGLGSLLADEGKIDEAIDYFKKAIKYHPEQPLPHYNLALAYETKGLLREAEAERAVLAALESRTSGQAGERSSRNINVEGVGNAR